jgi:hypothetical protein
MGVPASWVSATSRVQGVPTGRVLKTPGSMMVPEKVRVVGVASAALDRPAARAAATSDERMVVPLFSPGGGLNGEGGKRPVDSSVSDLPAGARAVAFSVGENRGRTGVSRGPVRA